MVVYYVALEDIIGCEISQSPDKYRMISLTWGMYRTVEIRETESRMILAKV